MEHLASGPASAGGGRESFSLLQEGQLNPWPFGWFPAVLTVFGTKFRLGLQRPPAAALVGFLSAVAAPPLPSPHPQWLRQRVTQCASTLASRAQWGHIASVVGLWQLIEKVQLSFVLSECPLLQQRGQDRHTHPEPDPPLIWGLGVRFSFSRLLGGRRRAARGGALLHFATVSQAGWQRAAAGLPLAPLLCWRRAGGPGDGHAWEEASPPPSGVPVAHRNCCVVPCWEGQSFW